MASLADPLVQHLLSSRHIASLATESPDRSIHPHGRSLVLVRRHTLFCGNQIA
jgi:hypothetical protein